MRWALLYARSRQLPWATAGALTSVVAVWALAQATEGDSDTVAIALAVGVTILAPGLTGQDVQLDRTAAIRWYPRRVAHLLLIGVVIGGAVLTRQALGDEWAPLSFVVRDVVGLIGLTALTATIFGGQFGWTLPLVWFAAAMFLPAEQKVAGWMFQPAGTTAATWTAVALGGTGAAAYAMFGNRR